MAQLWNLYERVTHKYRGGWRDEDQHQYVGQVKMLGRKQIRAGNGFDVGGVYVWYAVALPRFKHRDLRQAIIDSVGGTHCKHEHDCCGCASRRVWVRRMDKRNYEVRVSVTYNY